MVITWEPKEQQEKETSAHMVTIRMKSITPTSGKSEKEWPWDPEEY